MVAHSQREKNCRALFLLLRRTPLFFSFDSFGFFWPRVDCLFSSWTAEWVQALLFFRQKWKLNYLLLVLGLWIVSTHRLASFDLIFDLYLTFFLPPAPSSSSIISWHSHPYLPARRNDPPFLDYPSRPPWPSKDYFKKTNHWIDPRILRIIHFFLRSLWSAIIYTCWSSILSSLFCTCLRFYPLWDLRGFQVLESRAQHTSVNDYSKVDLLMRGRRCRRSLRAKLAPKRVVYPFACFLWYLYIFKLSSYLDPVPNPPFSYLSFFRLGCFRWCHPPSSSLWGTAAEVNEQSGIIPTI